MLDQSEVVQAWENMLHAESSGNATEAVRRYREKYPNWGMPNHTFLSVDCQL
jgi:hypothetical protein